MRSKQLVTGAPGPYVAVMDTGNEEYRDVPVDEQTEVFTVNGVVAAGDEGPQLHLHAVLGLHPASHPVARPSRKLFTEALHEEDVLGVSSEGHR